MDADVDPLINDEEIKIRGSTIDEILSNTGSFGRYQKILLLLSILVFSSSVTFQSLITYYAADDPPWRCVNLNISSFCRKGPFQEGTEMFTKRCSLNRDQWEYTLPKSYSFTTEFDLVCSNEYLKALSTALFFVGATFGAFISGPLSDSYGRKPVIIGCFLIEFLASSSGYFVNAVWQYLTLRLLIGTGFGSLTPTVYIYVSENVSPKTRAWFGNLYFIHFTVSMSIISAVAYYVPYWRKLVLFTSAYPLLAFILSWFLLESPHWLSSKGKFEKAEHVLKMIGRLNKSNATISLERKFVNKSHSMSYLHLFNNRKVLMLTVLQSYLWFGVGLVFYTIALESSNLGGNLYTNFILSSLADFPCYAITAVSSIYFGRKKVMCSSFLITSAFLISISLTPESYVTARVAMAVCGRIFAGLVFTTQYLWTFEIYPTVVRSKGMNVTQMFSRVGSAAAPFLSSVLQDVDPRLPYFIMTGVAVAGSIISMFLPEMLGKPTRKDYTEMYDGEKVVQVLPPVPPSVNGDEE
ncbi:solute carrier family 22 member 15-like [Clytia hemisphaerica]|uniref:Major facilitator superfamily (MFS) profile domain-containing protein n=1 Tax=Clytia hemisphaerica TaxID=252671 RepID=A0A7M5XC93_9CNID